MAIKTTGAEFKRFYNDEAFWPDDQGDTYHDDEVVFVNGVLRADADLSALADTDTVRIEGGFVYGPNWERGNEPSLETYFKRWRKSQSEHRLVVAVDASKLDAVKAAIVGAGGKVL